MLLNLVAWLLTISMILVSLFLMFIILLQRGRGGGLAGALGGQGGTSVFGAKADVQMIKFTCYIALAWGALNCISIWVNRSVPQATGYQNEVEDEVLTAPDDEEKTSGAGNGGVEDLFKDAESSEKDKTDKDKSEKDETSDSESKTSESSSTKSNSNESGEESGLSSKKEESESEKSKPEE